MRDGRSKADISREILKSVKSESINMRAGEIPSEFMTREIAMACVSRHGLDFRYVPDYLKTSQLALVAVRKNAGVIVDVPERLLTPKIAREAVSRVPEVACYVPERYNIVGALAKFVIRRPRELYRIPEQYLTDEFYWKVMRSNPLVITVVPEKKITLLMCEIVYEIRPDLLPDYPRTIEIAEFVIPRNPRAYLVYELSTLENFIRFYGHDASLITQELIHTYSSRRDFARFARMMGISLNPNLQTDVRA